MMRRAYLEPLSPEVESVLASERTITPTHDDLRRRALSRARVALVAGTTTRPWLGLRWTVAASLFVAASLSAAAIQGRHPRTDSLRSFETGTTPAPPTVREREPESVIAAGVTAPPPSVALPRPPTDPQGRELQILRPARASASDGDFTTALRAVAEHERRFPNGRLSEEREALRIQALSGLHRSDDARRAAGSFRQRFPESVLLSRMEEALRATP